jgi:hypothetical protein
MRWLRTIFGAAEIAQAEAYAPQPRDVYLPVIEVMVARDQAQSSQGLYVAAKGGHNNESHNHNDIGEFVVFRDGLPLLIDAGVETYSRKTFSPQRYEIWTMNSGYHNLPTINNVQQAPGAEYAARSVEYSATDQEARFTLDIAGAYPATLGLTRWTRTVKLTRGQSITIDDSYNLEHVPQNLVLNLLTVCHVDVSEAGVIRLSQADLIDGRVSGSGVIRYQAACFRPSVEEIAITDTRMRPVWGGCVSRILLTAITPKSQDHFSLQISEA